MDLDRMIARVEDAAKVLHPVLLGDCPEHAKAAHDALNSLTVVRVGLDLLKESA